MKEKRNRREEKERKGRNSGTEKRNERKVQDS